MKTLTRLVVCTLAVCTLLVAASAGAALAADNESYGETRWSNLPLRGALSKTPWVGSWWGYGYDGLAYRGVHDPATSAGSWTTYAAKWSRWDERTDVQKLSPAEKYDHWVGRADKIQYDDLTERAKKFEELRSGVQGLMDERRTLIRKLNAAIEANSGDSSFDWKTTDDGKRYLEVKAELETKEAEPNAHAVTVDTAFEYEVLNHGTSQFGVEGWFGHCNAWSAASIMEPEPRFPTTVDGIEFTPGDVKSYMTELYMEIQSSFYGSRNGYHEDEESRKAIDFQDITPAGFHILFADLIGNKDKGFVIDRYTGSQVWNQPARAFRSKAEALYEGTEGLERDVVYTTYGSNAPAKVERGKSTVFPVLVTTTIHWMSDGVAHEQLTEASINDEIDDTTFASSWDIESMWHEQVEVRTLTYELWLDRPMDDPKARIIGDGAWQHGSVSNYTALHPDFIWVPLANVNNYRDYENEFIDYDLVEEKILPGTLKPADNPTVEPEGFVWSGDQAIADNDVDNPTLVTVDVTGDLDVSVLTARVAITHTYIADLELILVHPDGRKHTLKAFGDGGSADDIAQTWDVKEFNGLPAAGTWTLEVRDNWDQDTGSVQGFELTIK